MPELSPALYRAGDGEPLVLIHGFTATWRCWLPVLGLLVPRFEVIAPTLHGHDGGPVAAARRALARRTRPTTSSRCSTSSASAPRTSPATRWAGRWRSSWPSAAARAASSRSRPAAAGRRTTRARSSGSSGCSSATSAARAVTERHHEQLLARPGFRRIGMRDIMARGHLMPAEEAVLLTRSSTRCSVVDDVFATMRDGSGAGRRPRPGAGADADRLGRQGPAAADGAPRRALPRRRSPASQFRVLRGLGHTPMWDDPAQIAELIADFATAAAAAGNGQAASVTAARRGRGRPAEAPGARRG